LPWTVGVGSGEVGVGSGEVGVGSGEVGVGSGEVGVGFLTVGVAAGETLGLQPMTILTRKSTRIARVTLFFICTSFEKPPNY
jgi:hypothetical protein